MDRFLLLVDHENVHEADFSLVDKSCQIIVYLGAAQNSPKAARNPATQHRFARVNFVRVEGGGRNALDFYIACQLGRTFEAKRETVCFVLSRDTGYDPLLRYLSKHGLSCSRVSSLEELSKVPDSPVNTSPVEHVVPGLAGLQGVPKQICPKCSTAYNVPLSGGRWCFMCNNYSVAPTREAQPTLVSKARAKAGLTCAWCDQTSDMAGGIYDDGEWMCGDCVGSAE